jgi:hypothetical protein
MFFFFGISVVFSQDKLNIKFGKITPADFEVSSPLIDSNVNAVVLADIGSSEFEGNTKEWFSLVFKKHKRIKILNNKGFDAAEISILLYSSGSETEKLEDISANTYNLENGTVVTTKVDSKSIFEEKMRKNLVKKKFTFPALKPGSIIEFTYTIKSDFIFNMQPWEFQSEYPCLWSEYEIHLPDFFNYVFLSQGYLPFDINKSDERYTTYTVRQTSGFASGNDAYRISTTVHDRRWVVKNSPAMKEESFTSFIGNHISKIEFQLSEYRFPNQPVKKIMSSWPKISEGMMEREDFGKSYTSNNSWLTDDLKIITKGASTVEEKARKIYEYIRDHFTCTNYYGIYLGDKTSLKDVFKNKSGSVSELNLLLIAMLRHESIAAEPVILSLRSRGLVHSIYPLMDRFNYLVCQVIGADKPIFLDASRPMLGFNRLPESCYNGTVWVMDKSDPYPLKFSADSIKEEKRTSVIIINDEKEGVTGSFSSQLGNYESYSFREKMSKIKKDDLLKEIKKSFTSDTKVTSLEIDSLNLYDEPVLVKYDFTINPEEDMIYFNPMFGESMKQNPFKSAQRLYPVEMSHTASEVFILDMEIPKGYAVEEIPKSVRYKLNEDEGQFEYICAKSADKIQLRSIVKINKANFDQDDYTSLRDFFSFIIKKQSEQIVFKKIK